MDNKILESYEATNAGTVQAAAVRDSKECMAITDNRPAASVQLKKVNDITSSISSALPVQFQPDLEDLPPEMIQHILRNLQGRDRVMAGRVNRNLNANVNDLERVSPGMELGELQHEQEQNLARYNVARNSPDLNSAVFLTRQAARTEYNAAGSARGDIRRRKRAVQQRIDNYNQ